jgi:hypothetical protein
MFRPPLGNLANNTRVLELSKPLPAPTIPVSTPTNIPSSTIINGMLYTGSGFHWFLHVYLESLSKHRNQHHQREENHDSDFVIKKNHQR